MGNAEGDDTKFACALSGRHMITLEWQEGFKVTNTLNV